MQPSLLAPYRSFRLLALLLVVSAFAAFAQPPAFAQTASTAPAGPTPVASRIAGPIDDSARVTLKGNVHPLAQAKFDRGPAPVSAPASRLSLVLRRSTEQEAALRSYLEAVQNPASPSYHKFLTPEQFGQLYGPSDQDIQATTTWLQSQGFTVNKVAQGRTYIEFSGSIGQIQQAFHTSIRNYVIRGESHLANATDPQIPAALSNVVAGVASLNDFRPRRMSAKGPSASYNPKTHKYNPQLTVGDPSTGLFLFVSPTDAATIYNTPNSTFNLNFAGGTSYDGTGATIGIAGDSNININQAPHYRSIFGLPANAPSVVVDGDDPGENGDEIEALLDTQVSGGLAPGAKVILYTAADNLLQSGLILAISRAIEDNKADILNISFGACEANLGNSFLQYFSNVTEQAAAQGMSLTVSTGDSGSAGCDNPNTESVAQNGLGINGFATPFTIAVGGTDYDVLFNDFGTYVSTDNSANLGSALGYIPEEPWNDSAVSDSAGDAPTTIAKNQPYTYNGSTNIIAAGGGSSLVYNTPSWQSGFAKDSTRNIPDVSFLAGNEFYGATWAICTDQDSDSTGNPVTDCVPDSTGSFYISAVGGTSAAAPAFAGMLALVKQKTGSRLGQADYVLYNLAKTKYASVYHDVTIGNNSVVCTGGSAFNCGSNSFLTGYNTGTGYDEATGLGSVNVTGLLNNWSAAGLASTTSALKLNGAATAVSITHGQNVTIDVKVASGSGGTPGGDVGIVDSLSPTTLPANQGLTGDTLTGGSVSFPFNGFPGGSYNVSAHYGGSSSFASSNSNAVPITVAPESSTTLLQVAFYDPTTGSQVASPSYGFYVVSDAQPYGNSSPSSGGQVTPNGVATGTVSFRNGSTTLGSAKLNSNDFAELQATNWPAGAYSEIAAYPGDPSFKASNSSATAFTIAKGATSSNVSPNSTSIQASASATLNVTIQTQSLGNGPTGTVTFKDASGTTVGTGTVAGVAPTSTAFAYATATGTIKGSALKSGSNSVKAYYNGDGNYTASTSSAVTITVSGSTGGSGTIAVSASPKTLSLAAGATTGNTSTISVTPGSGYTGTVKLSCAVSGGPTGAVSVPTCGLAASSVSITGTTAATTKLTVSTTAAAVSALAYPAHSGKRWYTAAGGAVLACLLLFGIPARRRAWKNMLGMVCILAALSFTGIAIGCGGGGGGGGGGTTKTTPTVTVTPAKTSIATSDSLAVAIAVAGSGSTPTGTITLSSGSYSSSATTLASGAASITIPANKLAAGTATLSAAYSGDSNYNAASGTASVTVSKSATTAGTYTVTITATDSVTSTITSSTTVAVTVQ